MNLTLDEILFKSESWCKSILKNDKTYKVLLLEYLDVILELYYSQELNNNEIKYVKHKQFQKLFIMNYSELKRVSENFGLDVEVKDTIKNIKFILDRFQDYNMCPLDDYGKFSSILNSDNVTLAV